MEAIVREAVSAVAGTDGAGVVTWPVQAWSARPAPRLRPRETYPIHDHPFPEVCIAVRGEARMHLAGHWFAFAAPALALIGPKLMHTEGRGAQRRGYCLLWLSCHGASLLGHASAYAPQRGRYCPGRVHVRGAGIREFHELVGHTAGDDGNAQERWARLRSVVLRVLVRMHEQVIDEVTRGPTRASSDPREVVVRWVREFLDEHYAEPIALDTLSTLTGYTPNHLNALFQDATGQPIRNYLTTRRLERAWRLCRESDQPIQAIAREVGYADPLYFSRAFRRYHGVAPTQCRAGVAGATRR